MTKMKPRHFTTATLILLSSPYLAILTFVSSHRAEIGPTSDFQFTSSGSGRNSAPTNGATATKDDESWLLAKQNEKEGRDPEERIWLGLEDPEEETKTYERVVLAGSKISISCPHSAIKFAPNRAQSRSSPFVTVQEDGAPNKHKQSGLVENKQRTVPQINTERVRWFRNHVLLQNPNHSFKRQSSLNRRHRNAGGRNQHRHHHQSHEQHHRQRRQRRQHHRHAQYNGEIPPPELLDEHPAIQPTTGRATTTNMIELNRTTELSRTPTAATNMEELQTRIPWTISNSARQSDPMVNGENVNELTGNRKQPNRFHSSRNLRAHAWGQEALQWYINEFDELVINKATSGFAGKYTCQLWGKESEVLLDVLMDSTSDRGSEQAFKMNEIQFKQAGDDIKVHPFEGGPLLESGTSSRPVVELHDSAGTFSSGTPLLNHDDHETGNKAIERNWQELKSVKTAHESSLGDKTKEQQASFEVDTEGSLSPSEDDKNLSSLSGLNLIKSPGDVVQNEREPGSAQLFLTDKAKTSSDSDEVPVQRDMMADNQKEHDTMGSSDAAISGLKEINSAMELHFMHQYRRHPVHLVKTETIRTNDLRLVPGFLYTKHQLHCPITGQRVRREHIYPLIRALCPVGLKQHSSKDTKELKCHYLVERLVSQLLGSTEIEFGDAGSIQKRSRDCSNSLLEIEWFKDGERLEFDTNGKGRDISLNLKLINFFDQFSMTSNSIGNDRRTNNTNDTGDTTTGNGEQEIVGTMPNAGDEASEMPEWISSNQAGSHRRLKWMCQPRGRTLELDGVREESAGRYTCALRLSISKLDRIIRNLQRLNKAQRKPDLNEATPHDNDISCCDEQASFASVTRLPGEQLSSANTDQIETPSAIKSPTAATPLSFRVAPVEDRVPQREKPIILASGDSLTRRAALLESILRRILAKKPSMIYVKQLLSRLQSPLTALQTFSVVVSERPANSSDLWSTITEASNAYARKRLADFKRLKRSSEKLKSVDALRPKSLTWPSSNVGQEMSQSESHSVNANELDVHKLNEPQDEHRLHSSPKEDIAANGERHVGEWQTTVVDGPMNVDSSTMELEMRHDRDDDYDILEASNGTHLNSNDNDRRRMLVSIGQLAPSDRLPLNYADESDIGARVNEQTKAVHRRVAEIAAPSNYANDRNLRSSLGEAMDSLTMMGNSGRGVESLDSELPYIGVRLNGPLRHHKRSLKANQEEEQDYYLASGAKELITERGSPDSLYERKFINSGSPSVANSGPSLSSVWMGDSSSTVPANDDGLRDQTPIIDGALNGWPSRATTPEEGHQLVPVALTDSIQEAQIDDGLQSRAKPTKQNGNSKQRDDELARTGQRPLQANKLHALNDRYRYDRTKAPTTAPNSAIGLANNKANAAEVASPIEPTISDFAETSPAMKGQILAASGTFNYQPELEANDGRAARGSSSTSAELFTEPIWPLSSASEDRLDESLMWSAGQYLYMHMRASAASSIFGVEVDVEWSNERCNATNFGINNDTPWIGESRLPDNIIPRSRDSYAHYMRDHDATPFATIDVIAGQSLQLQCTAHALGRLPEVKWYKLVNSIPTSLKGMIKMARRIGYDMYWPLTELDLLTQHEDPRQARSFVASQTTTIFDNLDNQTFTVVSSLQLSQYNDAVESETVKSGSLPLRGNRNLYACIVDADIRHNYATLGVHFRESPGKISSEISRRLRAKSVLDLKPNSLGASSGDSRIPTRVFPADGHATFDLFRENQLKFPLKNHWVSLQSESSSIQPKIGGFPLSPATLSSIIVLVFSFLLAMVYLTLRSYKTMTQAQTEEDLSDRLIEENLDQMLNQTESTRNEFIQATNRIRFHKMPSDPSESSDFSSQTRCLCQLEMDESSSSSQPNLPRLFEMGFEDCLFDDRTSYLVDYSNHLVQDRSMMTDNKTLYAAHSHSIENHYACHSLATSKLSTGKGLDGINSYGCQQFNLKTYQ